MPSYDDLNHLFGKSGTQITPKPKPKPVKVSIELWIPAFLAIVLPLLLLRYL